MRACGTVAAGVWLAVAGTLHGQAAPPDGEALLEWVIARNEAASAKIKSYSYAIEAQSGDGAADAPYFIGDGELRRSGERAWSISRERHQAHTAVPQAEEHRLVINDAYSVWWSSRGVNIASWHDHGSIAAIDPKLRSQLDQRLPFSFLAYAFGHPSLPLRQEVAMTPKIPWNAVAAKADDGRTVYHVRRFMPAMDDPAMPDCIWVIDPDKGWLATDIISYKADGSLWITHKLRLTEAAPGVWFPVEYEERQYGERHVVKPAGVVSSWDTAKVHDLRVNVEMPAQQFTFDAMGLAQRVPDVIVVRFQAGGGKQVQYIFVDGQLVRKVHQDGRRSTN